MQALNGKTCIMEALITMVVRSKKFIQCEKNSRKQSVCGQTQKILQRLGETTTFPEPHGVSVINHPQRSECDTMEEEQTTIALRITGPAGHKMTKDVLTQSTTIGDLKHLVENETGQPAAYFRLISRSKKLDDDSATLASLGIEHRTNLMCMHNERHAQDREGIQAIGTLMDEIQHLEAKAIETPNHVLHELVTQICCKLDEVETHGSTALKQMRKQALARAQALDHHQDGEES